MRHYPQLTSASISQYPVTRTATIRTITNELLNGLLIRMSDEAAAQVRWQLQYSSLTDGELLAINQLFEASEGGLQTFTFVDPTDNLLMWSEDLTKPAWTADPLLQVSTGITDPLGGSAALQLTNTAQGAQRVSQEIGGASWFHYCHSVYARSDAPVTVYLVQFTTGQELRKAITIGPDWTRIAFSANLTATVDGLSFGIELASGARIDVYGAQVEPQPAAGGYKKTTDCGGVYPATRFDSDSLDSTADEPNQNSCTVNLVSNLA